jgi:hypothetical protein
MLQLAGSKESLTYVTMPKEGRLTLKVRPALTNEDRTVPGLIYPEWRKD